MIPLVASKLDFVGIQGIEDEPVECTISDVPYAVLPPESESLEAAELTVSISTMARERV